MKINYTLAILLISFGIKAFSQASDNNQKAENASGVLAAVKQDARWGFINQKGETVIPFTFISTDIDPPLFIENTTIVQDDASKLKGAIDPKGQWIIKPQYEEMYNFSDGLALVKNKMTDKGNMFIDKNGKVYNFPGYDNVSLFKDNVAWATKNQLSGLIDKEGKELTPFIYHNETAIHSEGLIEMDAGTLYNETGDRISKCGYINTKGKVVIPPAYDFAFSFKGQYAIVSDKGKEGIIDKKGVLKLPFQYIFPVDYNAFNEGVGFAANYASYMNGDKRLGLLDITGKWIAEPAFDELRSYNDGLAAASQNGLWGYIDKAGHWVIHPAYEMAFSFSENLAAVKVKNGKWGFINKKGGLVINAVFEEVQNFKYGLSLAKQEGKYGFINTSGAWHIKPIYEKAGSFHNTQTGN